MEDEIYEPLSAVDKAKIAALRQWLIEYLHSDPDADLKKEKTKVRSKTVSKKNPG